MPVVLARIDDRLIHGLVTGAQDGAGCPGPTGWSQSRPSARPQQPGIPHSPSLDGVCLAPIPLWPPRPVPISRSSSPHWTGPAPSLPASPHSVRKTIPVRIKSSRIMNKCITQSGLVDGWVKQHRCTVSSYFRVNNQNGTNRENHVD